MNWYKFAIKKIAFRDAPDEVGIPDGIQTASTNLEKSVEVFELTNKRVLDTAKEIKAGAAKIGSEDINDITNIQAIANNLSTFESELNDFYNDQLAPLLGHMYNQVRDRTRQSESELEPEINVEETVERPVKIEKR